MKLLSIVFILFRGFIMVHITVKSYDPILMISLDEDQYHYGWWEILEENHLHLLNQTSRKKLTSEFACNILELS